MMMIRERVVPENVGILAVEVYSPSVYVDQSELEVADGVSSGKYTLGLGQEQMGFGNPREDAISMAQTVVYRLFERLGLPYSSVGRLDVGSESNVDRSKSIKTHIMTLFSSHGCHDIEGVDSVNACYGGTAALFNVVHWMESKYWNNRLGLVVMTDVAVYSRECSAHATGGAGAVALLVGPEAPLVFNPGMRVSYMDHTYDFYKPTSHSEFPLFDGPTSIQCYLTSALRCWYNYKALISTNIPAYKDQSFHQLTPFVAFHTPFSRLVIKALAYIVHFDKKLPQNGTNFVAGVDSKPILDRLIEPYQRMWNDVQETRKFEGKIIEELKSLPSFESYAKSLHFSKIIGNTYTNGVFMSLLSTLAKHSEEELHSKDVLVFSYGSGLASSLYSLRVRTDPLKNPLFTLGAIKSYLDDFQAKMDSRKKLSAYDYDEVMCAREAIVKDPSRAAKTSLDNIDSGVFYLLNVDDRHMRTYSQKP